MSGTDVKVDFSSTFYVNAVKSSIRKCIINQKANSCPMAIRLAWHTSGTYSKEDGTGGSNGATMRFAPESEDGANAGLGIERDILAPVKREFPELSYADIWTLAGCCAIEESGGPKIEHHLGRTDAADGKACPVIGRLPDAKLDAQHLRDVFYRMGFTDRDIVALSGAHTLGSCHQTRSGFDGPWTHDPLKFDNSYFKNLLKYDWAPRAWDGPLQYADPKNEIMMLPTDLALKTDSAFLPYVEEFAANQPAFFEAFKAAFEKLISLGCPAHVQPGAAPAAATADEADRLSRELREHCMHGRLQHAQCLLARGADPTRLEANSGRSALHKAAFWGHEHIVPWLITECKVPIDALDYNGDTALHDAARFGHDGCIKALLDAGSNAGLRNKEGKTAFDVAVENGKTVDARLKAAQPFPVAA